jgi:hypothetical protein
MFLINNFPQAWSGMYECILFVSSLELSVVIVMLSGVVRRSSYS